MSLSALALQPCNREGIAQRHEFVSMSFNLALYSIIRCATHRLTGKLTTSHLIRHMLITYLKRHGASDEVMRSLAEAMHHNSEMQGEIYDRRHHFERVAPAQALGLKLAMG